MRCGFASAVPANAKTRADASSTDAEVVELPQVDIRADRACLEAGEQMLGLRFQNHPMADVIQCGFFRRPSPAILS
jgi:hypothetical protein